MKAPEIKQPAEAIVLGLVSGLVTIYFLIHWCRHQTITELLYAAASIGLLSSISKDVARVVATGWMWLGQSMGKVVGTVLLTLVFFLILTPLSKLQQLFSGKGKFSQKHGHKESSWIERRHQFVQDDLKELW